jgi:signal recognition particle subunit SRP54
MPAAARPCRYASHRRADQVRRRLEKIDGLEVFDAERHAGRVLGMGDIVALVEEVQRGVDVEPRRSSPTRSSRATASTSTTSCPAQQMKKMGGLSG